MPPALALSFKGMKSFGGEPGGVVVLAPTKKINIETQYSYMSGQGLASSLPFVAGAVSFCLNLESTSD